MTCEKTRDSVFRASVDIDRYVYIYICFERSNERIDESSFPAWDDSRHRKSRRRCRGSKQPKKVRPAKQKRGVYGENAYISSCFFLQLDARTHTARSKLLRQTCRWIRRIKKSKKTAREGYRNTWEHIGILYPPFPSMSLPNSRRGTHPYPLSPRHCLFRNGIQPQKKPKAPLYRSTISFWGKQPRTNTMKDEGCARRHIHANTNFGVGVGGWVLGLSTCGLGRLLHSRRGRCHDVETFTKASS